MANNISQPYTGEYPDLHGRIPQRVVVKQVAAKLHERLDIGLWRGVLQNNQTLFDWLFEKKIEVRYEKLSTGEYHGMILIVTALFEKHTDLMECLLKFDLPVERIYI